MLPQILKQMNEQVPVRIDIWLHAARFFKTRALAADALRNGRVEVNGVRSKPSRLIRIGDQISVRKGIETFHLTVLVAADKRPSARIAAGFYEESEESRQERMRVRENEKINRALIEYPHKRPDKKARRKIIAFRQNLK